MLMNARQIDTILDLMKPEEISDALWMIEVFEQWNMPAEEADEWRRRILAKQTYLGLNACSPATE